MTARRRTASSAYSAAPSASTLSSNTAYGVPRRDRPGTRRGSHRAGARHRPDLPLVTVHTGRGRPVPRPGRQVLAVTPDRRVRRLHRPVRPVFVDTSGRRRRALRALALVSTAVLACLGLLLVAAMLDSRAPAPPLAPVPDATSPNP
ncbi:hypothetical protein GCM10011581_34170 [Saccharopolyspora subtropica]|uniref:Uncharacterized protein n=1 Tax=Saccharopolyspora thermophila TaxID=89367 RepID=A0A917NEW6_9PSEU|nr:hypothetical protein [Saccharopolyspora subtropica]GGI94215.1 hypothetical protein GCM10011581_34170 [Saccharopolyspora subtropica]